MGIGMFKVIGKSLGKALIKTGAAVGAVGAFAAGAALQDPELITPIWAALGPYGLLALPVLSIIGQTIQDAVRHSDKA